MKVFLLFLAIIGATNAGGHVKGWTVLEVNEIAPRNLNDLLMQFAAFIPFDKCEEIVLKYIQNDPDVQEAFQFMQSDEFADLANKVENMPEYKKSLKYLYDAGLDIYTYRNIIRGFFGLPPIDNPPPKFEYRFGAEESGIIKMVRELLSVLPIDDIRNWYDTVCFPNPEFQDFLAKIRSQEFKDLVNEITASKEYQDFINILRSQGIDVDLIQKIISDFLNGTNQVVHKHGSTRTLRSLVDQFKALLPLDDIKGIIIKYYLFNADFKRVVNYLKGDEFRQLVIKIEGLQQFKDFLAYLADHQLDVYNTLNQLLDLLGLPEVTPKHVLNTIHPSPRSGLTDMINEIYALLPIDEIVAWYRSTCEPDPEFQDLLAQLRGDAFKVVVQAYADDPAHTTIHNGLMSLDIDVAAVDAFLKNFFGWDLSIKSSDLVRNTRTLRSLVDQFKALLPLDDIKGIIIKYYLFNADFKRVVNYLKGDEFRQLVIKIEGVQEFKDFLAYLADHQLDVYNTLNQLLDLLGLPEVAPKHVLNRIHPSPRSGLTDMINEIYALLPIDDIVAWYRSTCEPDPEFQDLLAQLRGDAFKVVVQAYADDPAHTTIHNGLMSLDIDVAAVDAFLKNFFGWDLS